MCLQRIVFETPLPASAADVYAWHESPEAFDALIPPWEPVRVLDKQGDGIANGSEVLLGMKMGPLTLKWLARHEDCHPEDYYFRDRQVKGPFAHWIHTHRMVPTGPDSCILRDEIEYRLPLSPLSDWVAGWFVRRKLNRLFTYRHQIMMQLMTK
jgi:ligand-binding SRPBCC domain-containing protein